MGSLEKGLVKLREILNEEKKEILIEILDAFVKFCEENNLRYYLAYGTLLGAIRHKGFIPWDDDIDVVMPRPDYNNFLKISKNGLGGNLIVHSHNYTDNFIYPFLKVVDNRTLLKEMKMKEGINELGVNIDVFPMDGLPNDEKEINKHYKCMHLYRQFHIACVSSTNKWKNPLENTMKNIFKKIASYYGYKNVVNRMDRLAQKYDFNNSKKVGVVVWNYGVREVTQKNEYTNEILVDFEHKKYVAPANYQEILTGLYGEYLKLPLAEKRIPHHDSVSYWKN